MLVAEPLEALDAPWEFMVGQYPALDWISACMSVIRVAVKRTQANLAGPLALVVGNEGKGISRLVREHCDVLIKLPMNGYINSLNAAVAGSIALYEALRQRSQASKADK